MSDMMTQPTEECCSQQHTIIHHIVEGGGSRFDCTYDHANSSCCCGSNGSVVQKEQTVADPHTTPSSSSGGGGCDVINGDDDVNKYFEKKKKFEEILPLETIDDNLESNDRLYDRQSQAVALMEAYQRRIGRNRSSGCGETIVAEVDPPPYTEFVLLNGESGVGKTCLARAFGKQIIIQSSASASASTSTDKRRTFFLEGKCSRNNGCCVGGGISSSSSSSPYEPFVQVFEQLADQILSPSSMEEEDLLLENIKEMIEIVVGTEEIPLLQEMLPGFKRILGTSDNERSIASSSSTTTKSTIAATTPSPSSPKLVKTIARDKHKQFAAVLRRCIRALCCCFCGGSGGHDSEEKKQRGSGSLVIYIDDLQWATEPTLRLIESLVLPSMDHNQGFMIIGSCRGDEVSIHHPLSIMLRNVEANGTRITEIGLSNLTIDAIMELVRDTTTTTTTPSSHHHLLSREQLESIAQITWKATKGNPFYVHQYLRRLEEDRALYMDANNGVWVWNEKNVAPPPPPPPVTPKDVEVKVIEKMNEQCDDDNDHHHDTATGCLPLYLLERMTELPLEVQEVLITAACLGGDIIREVFLIWALSDELGIVAGGGDHHSQQQQRRRDQVQRALRVGVDKNFIVFHWESGTGKFVHDKFAEAAIMLIPNNQVASFQLRLGRNLQRNAKDIVGLPKALPTFINLILSGKNEIHCQEEKDALASLCLEAGRLMAKSSAFATAMEHVINGIQLLSDTHWEDQYKLSLSLYNAAAELSYCNGDHENVDKFVCKLKDNARCFEDGLQADTTQILSLGSRGLYDRAGALGIHALRKLGEYVPSKVSRAHAILEIYRAKRQLRGKSDEDIQKLPKLSPGHKALKIMSLLHVLYPIALMSHIEYTVIIACRLICLTLQYGLCSYSSVGFAFYGSTLARTGQVEEGYRFGELSLKIQYTKELMARSLLRVGLNLRFYKEPIRSNIETLLEANRLGMRSGDIETAMFAITAACGARFFSGEPLPSIAKVTGHFIQECKEYGQHVVGIIALPLLQLCLNLMGKAAGDPMVLTGDAMNEQQLMEQARAEHNTGIMSFILMLKFILATYLNELDNVESLSEQLRQFINRKHPPFIPILWTFHQFFEGIVAVSLASACKKPSPLLLSNKNQHLRIARQRLQTLRDAASRCPENMMNKVHLIEADLEASKGNFERAENKYRQSIVFAEHEGFLSEQALACEKLARMLLSRGDSLAKAKSYFLQARNLYGQYGAVILVDRINIELEALCKRTDQVSGGEQVRSSKKSFSSGCLVPNLSEHDFQIGCC